MTAPLQIGNLASELDELTFRRAQKGEAAACTALVKTYERRIFALLGRMVGFDRSLVEDLAQETFLRTFRALSTFALDGRARLSTWILTIATRLAIDELGRRKPTTSLAEIVDLPSPVRSDHGAESRALGVAIAKAAAGLSDDQRAVFLLRDYHELEYEEIAHALRIDVGTVKSRLHRARTTLKAALSEVQHG